METNVKNKNRLSELYKLLKETYIHNSDNIKSFVESTQIFSIPIFYHILFLFTIIKTILIFSYFVFVHGEYNNVSVHLIFIQLTTSFLLAQQQAILKIKNEKFKKIVINHSFLEQTLKYTYMIIFCIEENFTIYYFDSRMFNLNPGFIFFILLLIIFYDLKASKRFNEFLFYFYILNLVIFIYFFSVKNFMNFFLPILLVLAMFILLNLISQNYHKQFMKLSMHHNFFEKLVVNIFKLNRENMSLVYDGKIIYKESIDEFLLEKNTKRRESLTKRESCTNANTISEVYCSETKETRYVKKIPLDGFHEFELAMDSSFNFPSPVTKNEIMSFFNLSMFVKNSSNSDYSKHSSQFEEIYRHSKNLIKNKKLKELIEYDVEIMLLDLQQKIFCLLISMSIEKSCDNYSISPDSFITSIVSLDSKIQIFFDVNSHLNCLSEIEKNTGDLAAFLNFSAKTEENITKITLNLNSHVKVEKNNYYV
jgi:hypothetical protein